MAYRAGDLRVDDPEAGEVRVTGDGYAAAGEVVTLLVSSDVHRFLGMSEDEAARASEIARRYREALRWLYATGEWRPPHVDPAAQPARREVEREVDQLLGTERAARLRRLSLRIRGGDALLDEDVAGALRLTEEQRSLVARVAEENEVAYTRVLAELDGVRGRAARRSADPAGFHGRARDADAVGSARLLTLLTRISGRSSHACKPAPDDRRPRASEERSMASLITKVTSGSSRAPLTRLLTTSLGLDVWEVGTEHLVLQADEAQAGRLQAMGYDVEQLRSTEQYLSAFATDTAGYHTAATLEQDLRRLAEGHPEVAELHEVGRSVENRPLWALRIGERRGSSRKVAVLGCHHAREWMSVEVPYLLAEHLLRNSSSDPVQRWLQQGEVWVAPMVNPDGHEYSQTPANRLWRKNRRRNQDGSAGVDPNRNYGYMWGTLDVSTSSHVPADETYVGPRAFSEPEVRAVRDLVARQRISGVLSYHSYGQLILYPWGYTPEPLEDAADRAEMRRLAEEMQRLIAGVHGTAYTPQQSSRLYPTAGDTADWTYGEYDVPSLTVELRPASALDGGFVLPADQIRPCWEENRPAALHFVDQVIGGPRD